MDSSFHEQESKTQQQAKRSFLSLRTLASHIQWLASLGRSHIHLTEEEQEQAGIYLDRPGGE
jgi:hypothetical protein